MGGKDGDVHVRVCLHQPLASGFAGFLVGVEKHFPLGMQHLDRIMQSVADQDRAASAGVDRQRLVARRVPRHRHHLNAVADVEPTVDNVGIAGIDHGLDAVFVCDLGARIGPETAAHQPVQFVFVEQITRLGKGGHPAPVRHLRVPADVVGMKVTTQHEVHLVGLDTGGGEVLQVRPLAHVGRSAAAHFVVTVAAFHHHGVPRRLHDVGLVVEQDVLGGRIVEVRRQPRGVGVQLFQRRAGERPRRRERTLHVDHARDRHVAECPHGGKLRGLRPTRKDCRGGAGNDAESRATRN